MQHNGHSTRQKSHNNRRIYFREIAGRVVQVLAVLRGISVHYLFMPENLVVGKRWSLIPVVS